MNTKLVNEIWMEKEFEKEFEKELISFLNGQESKFFEKAFEEVEKLLSNRWVKMNNKLCYDNKIKACWLGLCEKSFSYKEFSSGLKLYNLYPYIIELFISLYNRTKRKI